MPTAGACDQHGPVPRPGPQPELDVLEDRPRQCSIARRAEMLIFRFSDLDHACRGGTFAQRRDAAIIAVFTVTGIRLSEMAEIRYHPNDPARDDLDLDRREIRITGKGDTARTVKIGRQAARALDRYLRARHP
jgi:site-specific recombinase XerD